MDTLTVLLTQPVFAIFVDAVDFATLRNLRLVCKPLLKAVRARCDPTHWMAARRSLVSRFADVETWEDCPEIAAAVLDTLAMQLSPHSGFLLIFGVCDPRFTAADAARFCKWLDGYRNTWDFGGRLSPENAAGAKLLARAKYLDHRWGASLRDSGIFYPFIDADRAAGGYCAAGRSEAISVSLRGRFHRDDPWTWTGVLFQVQLLPLSVERTPSDHMAAATRGFKYGAYGPARSVRYRVQMPMFGFGKY